MCECDADANCQQLICANANSNSHYQPCLRSNRQSDCDKFKPTLDPAVITVLPYQNDWSHTTESLQNVCDYSTTICMLHNSTQESNAKLERKMGVWIVTKRAEENWLVFIRP
jgi:hypothetical protein